MCDCSKELRSCLNGANVHDREWTSSQAFVKVTLSINAYQIYCNE